MVVWRSTVDESQHGRAAEVAPAAGLYAEEVTTDAGTPAGLFVSVERLATMTYELAPPIGRGGWYNQAMRGRHAVVMVIDPPDSGKAEARIHIFGWKRWIVGLVPGSLVAYWYVRNLLHLGPGPTPWGGLAFGTLVLLGLFVYPAFLITIWWAGCIREVLMLRRFVLQVHPAPVPTRRPGSTNATSA